MNADRLPQNAGCTACETGTTHTAPCTAWTAAKRTRFITTPTPHGHRDTVIERIIIKGTISWHGIGFVRAGDSARKEYGGPLVPGPWAYAFGLAHVIDNSGGTGAEMARLRADGTLFDVEEGDEIVIDGNVYRINVTQRGIDRWVTLSPVGA